ncbi:MAG: glycosyltransferase [Synergistes sp.]|nr:glycosyltransferase [Synergistes sp.]
MNKLRSIAVIYASEGTGHRTAALALGEAFIARVPDGKVCCFDILDFIPHPLKIAVSQSYTAMARYAPFLWGLSYWGSDKPSHLTSLVTWAHDRLCRAYLPRVLHEIQKCGVQTIIFTHYFGAAPTARAMRGKMPIFCVDTDFESHSFQRSAEFSWSFCGSERAVRQRYCDGITNSSAAGIPIAQKYKNLPDKAAARDRLGLPQDKRIVLLSGGGIGAGPVFEAAKSLAADEDIFTAAICGNNKKLAARMNSYFIGKKNIRTEENFISNMQDYYAAADTAVIKPGGLSSSEALCAGIPILLTSPIPGQEELNLSYLTETGAALALRRSNNAAEEIRELLASDTAQKMSRIALKIAKPNAADTIIEKVNEICALLRSSEK